MLRTAVYSLAIILSGFVIYKAVDSGEAVSGSVRFDNGDTAPFAEINVFDQDSKELVYSVVADENGQFSLEEMKPGKYEITLSYTGHKIETKTVRLENGESRDLGEIALRSLFSNDAYTIKPGVKKIVGS